MRKAIVKIHNNRAGILTEHHRNHYTFQYDSGYNGPEISLTMPVREDAYTFDFFPPFFEGVLPEGVQLEGLLKIHKIDRNDYFRQLTATGNDLIGAVTVETLESHE